MQNINKSFGINHVLEDVQFDLQQGEVHALIGENGAGKSTLMKILMGIYSVDSGEIKIAGEDTVFTNPSQALQAGVAMIHQELNPILDMTVAENIFMGQEKRKGCFVDKGRQEETASEYLEMLGVDIPPSTLMRNLNVSEMQMVEIAKTLSYRAKIIIMDEPTSAISDSEVNKLFDNIRKLKAQGIGIIYISHKSKIGEPVLTVRDAGREGEFKQVSFQLHQGEKLGIAGLMGAGRTELVMALFGAARLEEGSIEINGRPVVLKSPKDAINHKIALITENRKFYGLNLIATVEDNIVSVVEKKFSRGGFYNGRKGSRSATEMVKRLSIKVTGIKQIVNSLSGGNQQKVVLAKWLLNDPDIIMFDEPTRGIDVGAKAEVYKIIEQLACDGKAIIVISSEMPELIGLSHRMIVLHEGEVAGELKRDEMIQERIMSLASGYHEEEL